MIQLINGDCLEEMKKLEDNSVDIIFSDPPYALGSEIIIRPDGKPDYKKARDFMNKWDMPTGDFWADWFMEARRVLKHGGHCLVFGMDRQNFMFKYYGHLAGFTGKQSLYWYFISNFPKSSSLAKNLDKLIDIKGALEYNVGIWINSKTANSVAKQFQKSQTETGIATNLKSIVPENALVISDEITAKRPTPLSVQIVSWKLDDTKSFAEVGLSIAVENVSQNTTPQPLTVGTAEIKPQDQNQVQTFSVQSTVQIELCEKIKDKIRVVEAQRTESGSQKYWNKEDINVLCAELTSDLLHTTLNLAMNTQNLDTSFLTDYVSATIATITKSTMEDLTTSTASIVESTLKEKLISEKYSSHRYSIAPLKQTVEEIMVFQKPHKTGSCLHDTLAYESGDESITVGAVDIDGCRVGTEGGGTHCNNRDENGKCKGHNNAGKTTSGETFHTEDFMGGRYPSQTFCDSSVAERLDAQSGVKKSGNGKANTYEKFGGHWGKGKQIRNADFGDTGGASKILHKCAYDNDDHDLFIYAPKVSKAERNGGLDDMPDKIGGGMQGTQDQTLLTGSGNVRNNIMKNNHPCLKPQRLLTHILKLFKTPNPQVCLDPFMGSGSTGMACKTTGYDFIGMELNKEYFEIAEKRIASTEKPSTLFSV